MGVRNLTQQVKDVLNVYRDATERPYGYLMFGLNPNSSDQEQLKANLPGDEGYTTAYHKRHKNQG